MPAESNKKQADVVEQYTRQASQYAISTTHGDARNLAELVKFASLPERARVLDVATGTGFTAFAFAESGCRVTGLDLTAAMLSQAGKIASERGLRGIDWVLGRAETMPLIEGSFQSVTCRVSSHHFSDVPAFLKEARRVLKPDGAIIIADTSSPDDEPDLTNWFNRMESIRDASHQTNYSPSQWRVMMRQAGLQVADVDYSQRISMNFSDWVARSGTSPERIKELSNCFTKATDEIKGFFNIREAGEGLSFWWPVVRVKAIKT
jgi:ubiquinone/menaquinone biosynthesis C-methylase UbiE